MVQTRRRRIVAINCGGERRGRIANGHVRRFLRPHGKVGEGREGEKWGGYFDGDLGSFGEGAGWKRRNWQVMVAGDKDAMGSILFRDEV
jgi:hypothetical protein